MESNPRLSKSFGFWSLIVVTMSALGATDFFFIDHQSQDWAGSVNLAVLGLMLAVLGFNQPEKWRKLTWIAIVANFLVLLIIIWLTYFILIRG